MDFNKAETFSSVIQFLSKLNMQEKDENLQQALGWLETYAEKHCLDIEEDSVDLERSVLIYKKLKNNLNHGKKFELYLQRLIRRGVFDNIDQGNIMQKIVGLRVDYIRYNAISTEVLPSSKELFVKLFMGQKSHQEEMDNMTLPIQNEQFSENLKQKGNAFMREKNYGQAILSYSEAIEAEPENPIYYCNRAAANLRLDRFGAAVADCEHAIDLAPDYGKAHLNLGHALNALGQYDEAKNAFMKAYELNPQERILQMMDTLPTAPVAPTIAAPAQEPERDSVQPEPAPEPVVQVDNEQAIPINEVFENPEARGQLGSMVNGIMTSLTGEEMDENTTNAMMDMSQQMLQNIDPSMIQNMMGSMFGAMGGAQGGEEGGEGQQNPECQTQ
ncbi:hypothetical protein PCE1_000592 [Barthelona sp. PCE]